MGHLLSFSGTDTVSAIDFAENYYGANSDEELVGCSVPATEHSVMCMGTKEDEIGTFRRLITDLYPKGIVSIVSDTWDFWKVITEYTLELKDEILNRQPNDLGLCKTVFRPDSGDPVKILTGYRVFEMGNDGKSVDFQALVESGYDAVSYDAYDEPVILTLNEQGFFQDRITEIEAKGAVECLWDIFGGTETDKGYKMLNDKVGLIYGDSITRERAIAILDRLEKKGFAASNVVFGVGSYTYQYMTRDTLGFAMKATYGEVNGEPREIFKDPVTDSGTKKSAKGLMVVHGDQNGYYMLDGTDWISETMGFLEPVFENGEILRETKFSEIRQRARGEAI
jgi:nicotinamide phosphoribosyltransferase